MRHSTSMLLFDTTLRNEDKIYFPNVCDIAIQCTKRPSWWHFQMSFVFQIVNFKHNCECYMVLRHHIDNKLKLFQLSLSEPILPRFTYTNTHIQITYSNDHEDLRPSNALPRTCRYFVCITNYSVEVGKTSSTTNFDGPTMAHVDPVGSRWANVGSTWAQRALLSGSIERSYDSAFVFASRSSKL